MVKQLFSYLYRDRYFFGIENEKTIQYFQNMENRREQL